MEKRLTCRTDTAERTGFEHVDYPSAAFKKREGMPPNRFRAENRK
jgi:AraC-like DNA-binding protein